MSTLEEEAERYFNSLTEEQKKKLSKCLEGLSQSSSFATTRYQVGKDGDAIAH